MKKSNLLIGLGIGAIIAYLILKPKNTSSTTSLAKANASGSSCSCGNTPCTCGFSKDPNAPQSQPYLAEVSYSNPNIIGVPVHIGFSDPKKEVYNVSPYKHFGGVSHKNLLGIDSSIVGGCC